MTILPPRLVISAHCCGAPMLPEHSMVMSAPAPPVSPSTAATGSVSRALITWSAPRRRPSSSRDGRVALGPVAVVEARRVPAHQAVVTAAAAAVRLDAHPVADGELVDLAAQG